MAKRRASKNRPRRKEVSERREPVAPAREDEPPPSERAAPAAPRRPWWLLALAASIVAVVVALRWGSDETIAQDGDPRPRDAAADRRPPEPERLRPRVVRRYPHATDAFTQGLLWHEGFLYESTGLRGYSTLRRVRLESGEVLERRDLDPELFAEGLALVGDRLIQLTWTEGQAHVWSVDGFRHRRTFSYEGEGWGLCHDGRNLVMSDGSDRLTFRDPETFRVVRQVSVREGTRPVGDLNELECVNGSVWANVWQTDRIVRIDPRTGHVTAVVNAGGLLTEDERRGADVLNGIAWIPERQRFVITGKHWPYLFEIELEPDPLP